MGTIFVHNATNAIFNKKDAQHFRSSIMKKFLVALTAVFMITGITVAQADTLLINSAFEKPEAKRPTRGQSMDKVSSEFGEPLAITGPVGDPPITTWDYEEFSVYFEYDKVLHSVMRREQPEEENEE